MRRTSLLILGAAVGLGEAFHVGMPAARPRCAPAARTSMPAMEYEEVEFIIHPDGRVEERVRGIKGMACEELTKEINKQLGEVYEVKATSEMYEQKIEVNVEAENTVSESWGTTSWGSDGSSGGGSSGGEW